MIPLGVMASGRVSPVAAPGGLTFAGDWVALADAATYTFHGVPIGAPAAGRRVVVVATTRKAQPSGIASTITIGGVTATLDAARAEANSTGSAALIASAVVPTGTTADVVVTWNSTQLRAHLAAWVLPPSTVVLGAADATGSTASLTLGPHTVLPGDMAVGGLMASGNPVSWTWTGFTTTYGGNTGAEPAHYAGGGAVATTTTFQATGTPSATAANLAHALAVYRPT